ncbi:hypothetical protein HHK36_006377 [Tetracentron sinense]|uniref:Uncharacterized protein n=1 Tax=Tetracentron sinense TaxID=13715 RepID=A0A834ZKB1_TETSI|nr:hypothetical protein HHK36_006377 [Tetracentron sinense]
MQPATETDALQCMRDNKALRIRRMILEFGELEMDESNTLQVFFNGGLVKQETAINDVKNDFMEGMVVLDFDMLWAMVSLHICKKIEENWRGLMNMEVKLMELRGYVQEKFSIALKINSLNDLMDGHCCFFTINVVVHTADSGRTWEKLILVLVLRTVLMAMITLHVEDASEVGKHIERSDERLRYNKEEQTRKFGTGSTLHGADELKKSEELKRGKGGERSIVLYGLSEQSVAKDESKKKAHAARFDPVSKTDTLEGDKKKAIKAIGFHNLHLVLHHNQMALCRFGLSELSMTDEESKKKARAASFQDRYSVGR